jgi:hypothetical protein
MFRISGRRPPVTLDDATIERLLDGGAIDDLPDALRPLGEVLAAATSAPSPQELEGSTAAAASFVTARAAAGHTPRRTRSIGVSVFTVLVLAASTGTAVAATRGSLPDPMQQVAHDALGVVGIAVPSINDGSGTHDHGNPAVATDGSSVPPVSAVAAPTTVPGSTSETGSTANSSNATTANPSDDTTGNSGGNSDGQSGETGPPESPPGQVDKPADQGGGQSGDTTSSPGNSDFGHAQGAGSNNVPPGQAKKG